MSGKTQRQIEQAAAALKAEGAREVYLFGSAAGPEDRGKGDIDLAVAGLPPARFFAAFGKAQDLLDRPLDLVDLDQDIPFTRYLRQAGELRRVG